MAGSHEDITDRKHAEEELAHERHLLRCLMDTSPDKIYFKDRYGRYIRVNKALADKFGLSDPAQVVGKTVHDIFTPEYARQTDAQEEEIMRTGQPQVAEDIREPWPDGRVTWESTTKMPLRDANGLIIGTIGISRNIAQRKQAEEALRQSEERYRAVIAAMPDGIVIDVTDLTKPAPAPLPPDT
jgi:PAS domain S-box-containing protein